jgi:iron complex outermembrane receptor protein
MAGSLAAILLSIGGAAYAASADSGDQSTAQDKTDNQPGKTGGGTAKASEQTAQAAPATPATEEVTVTARRREENVQDVPIPVTVLNGAHLEDNGVDKLEQLQFEAPSTSIYLANPRQAAISIRGLGNNPANDGLVDSVGIYFDGVYLDRSAMANFGLFDINQVEVLRGPQGTLFGKNTTAGAINITTNKPTFTPETSFSATLGSYATQEYQGYVNGPIVGNILAGRLSFDSSSHSGYVTNFYPGGLDYDGLGRQAFRGQLLYQPDADFTLRLIGEYGRERDNSGLNVLYSAGPLTTTNASFHTFTAWTAHAGVAPIIDPFDFKTDANGEQVMRESVYAGTANAEWKLPSGFALTSITAIRGWNFEPHNNNIDTIAPLASNGIPLSQQDVNHDTEVTQELRLASPTGGPVDYVTGLYYFYNVLHGDQQQWYGSDYSSVFYGSTALNNGLSKFDTDPTTNSIAAFGQANWHIDNKWTLTGGLRETFEQNTIHIIRYDLIGGTPPIPATVGPYQGSDAIRNWNLSALASLSYKVTDDVLAYTSLSHGSKAGGFNSPAVPAQSGSSFLPTSSLVVYPETANDAEVGVKSDWFDRHLTLNADAFFTRVTNYQASTYISTPLGVVSALQNVGAVITKGFEVDATARPLQGWSVTASGSFDPAIYQSFRNAPSVEGAVAKTQDLTGRPVVGAPKWTASISSTYTRPVTDTVIGYFTAEYAYKSGQFGYIDDSPYSWLKAYGIANFRLGAIIAEHYDWSVWVENAFDTPNFYSVQTMAGGLGGYTAAPGIPCVFGTTFRVKF